MEAEPRAVHFADSIPRRLPPGVAGRTVLGQPLAQIGALLCLINGGVLGTTANFVNPRRALAFSGTLERRPGEVTAIGLSGSRENRQPVHTYRYIFNDPSGVHHTGVSYGLHGPRVGDDVVVEFPSSDPETSRVVGLDASVMSPIFLLPMSLPTIIGVVMVIVALRKGFRDLRLMTTGQRTLGRRISSDPTPVRINGKQVYAVRFAFQTNDGAHCQTVSKTTAPDALSVDGESILYDPKHPAVAAVVKTIAGAPQIDATGRVEAASSSLLFILPCLGAAALAFAIVRLFGMP